MIHRLLMRLTRNMPARAIDLDQPGGTAQHYIERYRIGEWRGITAYLHRYLGSDGDRDLHDHPWAWSIGIPLIGGYTEERFTRFCTEQGWRMRLRTIWRFRPNFIGRSAMHRIASVQPGTWTLFMHGKRETGWGFVATWPSSDGSATVMYVKAPSSSIDTSDARARWHETAPTGAQLRADRGT